MHRSLAAMFCLAAALAAPTPAPAGVIPWMYDSVFGYGPAWRSGWGYGGGFYQPYSVGYAPMYGGYGSYTSYGSAGGCSSCGTAVSNYVPSSCGSCAPCGGGCSPCGGCDTGCGSGCGTGCSGGNCSGGNCGGTGSSVISSQPTGQEPNPTPARTPQTYRSDSPAPKSLPGDDFSATRNRGNSTIPGGSSPSGTSSPIGAGTSTPPYSGYTTPSNPAADPNNSAIPYTPANAEPGNVGPRRNEDMGDVPQRKLKPTPGDTFAFRLAPSVGRSQIEQSFQLPVVVDSAPRIVPVSTAAPAAIASK